MQYFTSQPLIPKHLQSPPESKSSVCKILRVTYLYSKIWPTPARHADHKPLIPGILAKRSGKKINPDTPSRP
jgi:hypothetical protein